MEHALELLAKKLGTTVEALWPYMVRYEYMHALITLVVVILGGLMLGATYVLVMRWLKAMPDEISGFSPDVMVSNEEKIAGLIVARVVLAVILVFLASTFVHAATNLSVPEAAAIRTLLSLGQ